MSGSGLTQLTSIGVAVPVLSRGLAVPINVVLTTANSSQTFNLASMKGSGSPSKLVTMQVDNRANSFSALVSFPDSLRTVEIVPGADCTFPAITTGLIFTVSAPQLTYLPSGQSATMAVQVQCLDYYEPPINYSSYKGIEPQSYTLSFSYSGGVWTPAVVALPGTGVWNYLYVNNYNNGCSITISGTGIAGPWTLNVGPLMSGQFPIPPTLAGMNITIAGTTCSSGVSVTVQPQSVATPGSVSNQLSNSVQQASGVLQSPLSSATLVNVQYPYGWQLLSFSAQATGIVSPSGPTVTSVIYLWDTTATIQLWGGPLVGGASPAESWDVTWSGGPWICNNRLTSAAEIAIYLGSVATYTGSFAWQCTWQQISGSKAG